MAKRSWVLFCKLSGYFKAWTAIGPSCTNKIVEAAHFDSKRATMQSPAYSFALTCFEPKKVP